MNKEAKKTSLKTSDLSYIALGAVLMSVCAWITIPSVVPFTMQTFALFCLITILGGKRTLFSLAVYCLMGVIGLPVFAGFKGGAGVLFGSTGGYILGFFLTALCALVSEKLFPRTLPYLAGALVFGLILCYAFGTAWFIVVYARASGAIGVGAALSMCVLPFVLPDLIKLTLGMLLGRRVKKIIKP